MSDTAYITVAKKCALCERHAEYDARITKGPHVGQWANLCGSHWQSLTHRTLGTGVGQRLVIGVRPIKSRSQRQAEALAAINETDFDSLWELVGDGDVCDLFG